jgi:exosortase A
MSAVLAPATSSSRWPRALAVLVGLWLMLGLLYADTVAGMVWIWIRSETFAHAFLVPPIVGWLIWRRRELIAEIEPRAQPAFLLALLPLMALWLAGELVKVNAAIHFAWVAMLVVCVPATLGWRVTREMTFPLLFLFFAVPFGDFMLHPMMDWTADFTIAALQATGIPVYREGLHFVIPSGSWSVVEACSGVRYLIASFMVGALFAYLNYQSNTRRAVFMIVSIVVPIVANWLRAYGIVMLGHLSGNKLAVGVDHLIYGWVFFGVVIGIMFVIGARWSEPDAPRAERSGSAQAATAVPGLQGVLVGTAVVALALIAVPRAVITTLQHLEKNRAEPVLALPADWGPRWASAPLVEPSPTTPPSFESYRPQFMQPTASARRGYQGAQGRVGVYIVYYRDQGGERELVSSINHFARDGAELLWNQVSLGRARVDAGGVPVPWVTAQLHHRITNARSDGALTAWRAYWVNGRWLAGDAEAKLNNAWSRLTGHGDDSAAVVLWADGATESERAARLEAFVRDNAAALNDLLRRVPQPRSLP